MSKLIMRILCVIITVAFASAFFGCRQSDDFDYVDINHIINPSSGMPYSVVYNDESGRFENTKDHIISATVLSPSSMEGDSYSTAICVMGVDKAKAFIEAKISQQKITSAMLFTENNRMLVFGDIVAYNNGDAYSEYKKYQLVHGGFCDDLNLTESLYQEGSYSKYSTFVFSETIEFEITIFGKDKQEKDEIKDDIILLMESLDNQINATKSDSDIAKINMASKGTKIQIGNHTYKLLSEAISLYDETEGAFNIAVAPLSRLWNVDIGGIAEYRAKGNKKNWTFPARLPTLEEIAEQKEKTDIASLQLSYEEGKYYATKSIDGLELDLGAIAKGYAVDICAELLAERGVISAQLNISGNIYEYGNYFDKKIEKVSSWKIGVTDPSKKHDIIKNYVCAFQVAGDISIVTSGDYERFYSYGYAQ